MRKCAALGLACGGGRGLGRAGAMTKVARGGDGVFVRVFMIVGVFVMTYWALGTFHLLRRQGARNRLRLFLAAALTIWASGMVFGLR